MKKELDEKLCEAHAKEAGRTKRTEDNEDE